jgi:hypothetical protein
MKILFTNGPLILVLDGGIEIRRNEPCEIPDDLALALIEQGGFQAADELDTTNSSLEKE